MFRINYLLISESQAEKRKKTTWSNSFHACLGKTISIGLVYTFTNGRRKETGGVISSSDKPTQLGESMSCSHRDSCLRARRY